MARINLARLESETDVMMIEPVPYAKVRGAGFYRQFLNTGEWPTSCGRPFETRRGSPTGCSPSIQARTIGNSGPGHSVPSVQSDHAEGGTSPGNMI